MWSKLLIRPPPGDRKKMTNFLSSSRDPSGDTRILRTTADSVEGFWAGRWVQRDRALPVARGDVQTADLEDDGDFNSCQQMPLRKVWIRYRRGKNCFSTLAIYIFVSFHLIFFSTALVFKPLKFLGLFFRCKFIICETHFNFKNLRTLKMNDLKCTVGN